MSAKFEVPTLADVYQALQEAYNYADADGKWRLLAAAVQVVIDQQGNQLHYQDCADVCADSCPHLAKVSRTAGVTAARYRLGADRDLINSIKEMFNHEAISDA